MSRPDLSRADARDVRIGIAQLELRLGCERTTIWRRCKAGFPAPHYLGSRRYWFLSEIESWEAAEMARAAGARPCNLGAHARPGPKPEGATEVAR